MVTFSPHYLYKGEEGCIFVIVNKFEVYTRKKLNKNSKKHLFIQLVKYRTIDDNCFVLQVTKRAGFADMVLSSHDGVPDTIITTHVNESLESATLTCSDDGTQFLYRKLKEFTKVF